MRAITILVLGAVLGATLAGCGGPIFSSDSIFAPRPFKMGGPDKNAPPDYLHGWNDGCETGLSTMVSGYYKSFYKYKQDMTMLDNEEYYKAWKDAYTYCRHYSFRYTWMPFDKVRKFGPLCVLCPQAN